jgi:amidase
MYLDRIHAYDQQGPKLNAILTINPHVLDEASQSDAERKQTKSRGPLHGIPIILKDNYNTKDMPTTGGTIALKGFIPADDAFTVKKLRDAGAIILGKANTHELALAGTTISSLGGQTLNPYDLTKTPGGSSGGTAAAVTANFAVAGTGSDTVNSIRSPASANNLVGIRPTKGLVSIDGIIPVSFTQDEAGPITRTVEDAAIMLDAMRGFDPNDSYTALSQGRTPVKLTSFLDKHGLKGKRIGILQNCFGNQPVHQEVNRVTNEAIKEMKGLGATLVPITIPNLDTDHVIMDYDVQKYEIKTELNKYFSKYGSPVKSLEELLAIGQFDPSIANTLKTAQSIDSPLEQPDYKSRLAKMENLKKQILQVMKDNRLDSLLYPHQKRLVVNTGGASQVDRNGILASVTGLPAITFQGGFSTPTETAPLGIPVGIELLGKPFSEPILIQMAYGFEKGTDHRRMPHSTPADLN